MIWVITFEKSATKEEIGLKQTQSQKSLWSSGYGRRLILRGHGFKSRLHILDGYFFTLICCKNCIDVCSKRPKINEKRPGLVHLKNVASDLFKRCTIGDCKYEQESLARPHVLLPHGGELFLPGRVEDVKLGHLVVDDALLCVRVLDGGVVVGDEITLDH